MNMRNLPILALSLVFSRAMAQDLNTHVTYSTRAARCSEVIKAIAEVSHTNLQTSPQMADEILAITVDGQLLGDVLSRIATVTSGDWKHEGDILRLVPNQQVRTQEDRALVARRANDFRKAIEARLKNEKEQAAAMEKLLKQQTAVAPKPDKSKTDDGKSKVETKVNPPEGTPEFDAASAYDMNIDEQLITRLLNGIDASVIGQMVPGDRLVFSTDPTRLQRSLSHDASDLVNAFILKHNDKVSKSPNLDMGEMVGGDTSQMEDLRRMNQLRSAHIGAVAKVNLVIKSTTRMGISMGDVELRLYDAKGNVVHFYLSNLGIGNSEFMADVKIASGPDGAPPVKAAPTTSRTPIEYSEDSKALLAATRGSLSGGTSLKLSPEIRKRLMQPDKYDPLSFTATDECLALAKKHGQPLIADISDDWDSAFSMGGRDSNQTIEDLEARLKEGRSMSIIPDKTWLVLKPSFPPESRSIRMNRSALTRLLRAATEKDIPSLDDMAAFAADSPDPSLGGMAIGYLMLFVPGSMMQGFGSMVNWTMFHVYSQMSPEARVTLANGGRVYFANLPSQQRVAVESLVYGADSHLIVLDPTKKRDEALSFFSDMMPNMGADADYRTEPTEIAQNGLPNDGYFELQTTRQNFASPQGTSDSPLMAMLGVMGPDEMAFFTMMKQQKGAEQFASMLPNFGKLKIGNETIYNFTFQLGSQVMFKRSLRDHVIPANSQIVSENNLPAEFQRQIDERMKVLKKAGIGNIGGMFGDAIHP